MSSERAPVPPTNSESKTESVELTRELGLAQVTLLGVGALIGAGVFVLIGSAAGEAGPALLMAFALNGLIVMLTAMVYAELGSAIPSAGGSYVFVREALPDGFAFLAGWMSWFAISVAGSLYSLGFGSFSVELLTAFGLDLRTLPPFAGHSHELPAIIIGLGIAAFITWVNTRGASETGTLGVVVTVAKVLVILVFAMAGLWAMGKMPEPLAPFTPLAPRGLAGVLTAMGLTYIAFEGAEVIVKASEEMVEPKRNLPKAIMTAVAVVVTVYLLVSVALVGGIRPPAGTDLPAWAWLGTLKELGLAEAAGQILPYGHLVILIGALLSTVSALNAAVYSSSRTSFAMGRDLYLPRLFARIDPELRTPRGAIYCSGALIASMLLLLPLEEVAAAASLMFLLVFLMVNTSSILIRRKYGRMLAYGYVTPFFPFVPVTAILMQLVLAFYMLKFSTGVLLAAVGWITAGAMCYVLNVRPRQAREARTPVALHDAPLIKVEKQAILVPVARTSGDLSTLRLAIRLAERSGRLITLLHVVTVPRQLPLSAGRQIAREMKPELDNLQDLIQQAGLTSELLIRIARTPAEAIRQTIAERHPAVCLMGWRGASRGPNRILGSNLDRVVKGANCPFMVLESTPPSLMKILVPVANPRQSRLAVLTAVQGLDPRQGGRVDILRIFPVDTPSGDVEASLEELRKELSEVQPEGQSESSIWILGKVEIHFIHRTSNDLVRSLSELSSDYDQMILGVGPGSRLRREVLGALTQSVVNAARCPVAVVKSSAGSVHFQLQKFFDFFRDEPVVRSTDPAAQERPQNVTE